MVVCYHIVIYPILTFAGSKNILANAYLNLTIIYFKESYLYKIIQLFHVLEVKFTLWKKVFLFRFFSLNIMDTHTYSYLFNISGLSVTISQVYSVNIVN